MNEVIGILKNTGLLTTVGGPICIYYCIARVRGKFPLGWYPLVPFIQAYFLTGIYFSIYGPRIETTHLQTFLYVLLGSNILTTGLCVIVFLTKSERRPNRPFPWDLGHFAIAIFGAYPFWLTLGVGAFYSLVVNDQCEGARCEGVLAMTGRFGYTGTLFCSALCMGLGALLLNLVCFILGPYVPPEERK